MRRKADLVARPVRLMAAVALTAGALMACATAPVASARTSHNYESTISEVPSVGPCGPVTMPGALERATSMTVFSGDLYVAERLEGSGIAGSRARTDQFAPSGSKPGEYEFASQLPLQSEPGLERSRGIAFGSGAGETEMYIGQAGPPGVDVFGFSTGLCGPVEGNLADAHLQKTWNGAGGPSPFKTGLSLGGVAVDHSTAAGDWASGDVFAADEYEQPVISIFKPEAGGAENYVGNVTGPWDPSHELQGIAVSGFDGDLVVSATLGGGKAAVYVFRPEEEAPGKGKYGLVEELLPPSGSLDNVTAVAVDDSNGEIYVATTTSINQFGPEGAFRGGVTGVPREGIPTGVNGQNEEAKFNENTARPVSLAVDPVSHHVFVGVFGSQVGPKEENLAVIDVLSPDIVVPDPVTEAPANLKLETDPETGAESWGLRPTGTVNPDSAGEATCWFAWGPSPTLGQEAPCSAAVHNGTSPVHVHASLSGLAPDTTYYYRLQARNANGVNLGEESQTYSFTTPGPGLRSESVSAVSSQGATLEATIAPHDAPSYPKEEHSEDLQEPATSPTSYYFQYSTHDTSTCAVEPSMCVSVPVSPASVGSGASDVAVSQPARGLSPSTTYHYRLVAANEALPVSAPGVLSAFYGADRTFTTQPPGAPLALPDGRAWEMVSPVDKHGARIEKGAQAAVDGGRFAFVTGTPTSTATNGYDGNGDQVLASRVTPGVWSSVDVSLSHNSEVGVLANVPAAYRFFSEDLSVAVAESVGPFSVPEGWHQNSRGEWEKIVEAFPVTTERTPYVRHNTTCQTQWSTCFEPLLDKEDVTSGLAHEGSATANEGAANFVGATPDGSYGVLRSYVRLTGEPVLGGGPWLYEWSASRPAAQRLSLVSSLRGELEGISSDGSLLFFANPGFQLSELYVHDMPRDETAELDLTEGGLPGKAVLRFGGASADGSRAFFTDATQLRQGAGITGSDLYVCDVEGMVSGPLRCALRDLTPIPGAGQPGAHESARVSRVLGISRDGSYVYFVAKGVQAQGAIAGEENVYVAHELQGVWTTSLIASSPSSVVGTSAVSPDGGWLSFSSVSVLTGYDNRDVRTGLPDSEVYLYDAQSQRLACVSCSPTGARPVGSAMVPPAIRPIGLTEDTIPAGDGATRSLFDNGRVFFDSGDALVPQDTNDNVDVYEFEPAGVPAGENACSSASATFDAATGGCVGLISSGVAYGASVFLEASGAGGDVFFTTTEHLVSKDVDTAADVYDAHECTAASPCPPAEPAPSEECSSAASCRQSPALQPSVYGAPSSATFSGTGNIAPAPSVARPAARKAVKVSCRKKRSKRKRIACERQTRRARRRVKSSRAHGQRRAGR